MLIEFDGPGRPIIVDRPLYRELVKTAINRTHGELQAKAEAAAKEKKTARAGKAPADPVTTNLATVDPTDITVARFFVLCGRRHKTNYADRLTMRISRCRTRGTATRLDVAPPKHAAVALVAGRRTDSGAPRWTASTWARDC